MRDMYSNDVETAGRLECDRDPGYDDRPSRAELESDGCHHPVHEACGVCWTAEEQRAHEAGF